MQIRTRMIESRMLLPEENDLYYKQFKHMDFRLDFENWRMMVISDVRIYNAVWDDRDCRRKFKTFALLLSKISSNELLDRIAKRNQFDLQASKERTLNNLKQRRNLTPEQTKAIQHAFPIDPADFYSCIRNNVYWAEPEDIAIVCDYPFDAKLVTEVFTHYIQPTMAHRAHSEISEPALLAEAAKEA